MNDIGPSLKKFIYSIIAKKFLNGCSDYNSLDVRRSIRTKEQSKKTFEALNIPTAKARMFYFPFAAFSFVKEHGFPVCVKPDVSGYSRGSHFPIENYKQLLKACIMVKIWWPKSIIETYLSGRNYRIVTIKGEVMSIIQRYPPSVTGNGSDNISTLIDEENAIRTEMKLSPTIYQIPKDHKAIAKHLKLSNRDLNTIPDKDEVVYLHHKIALKLGSIVEVVDKSTLTEKNHEVLQKILSHLDANILGIDVIAEEPISVDFDKQKCIFLELNSRPYLRMHDVPRYGEKEDLSPYYAKLDKLEIENQGTY